MREATFLSRLNGRADAVAVSTILTKRKTILEIYMRVLDILCHDTYRRVVSMDTCMLCQCVHHVDESGSIPVPEGDECRYK